MLSTWHSHILGTYNPQDRLIGLDFRNLFTDPVMAEITWFHELTHSVLSRTTDFGQATEAIYYFLPHMKHLTKEEKQQIMTTLKNSQIFVQEGTASLVEICRLKDITNRRHALEWAKQHMPSDYYERFDRLSFLVPISRRYIDFFLMKVPHLSMHTGFRKKTVEEDLFANAKKLIEFLSVPENTPDGRYNQFISYIKGKEWIVTKPENVICESSGVPLPPNIEKQDVADFINYLASFTDKKGHMTIAEIGDPPQGNQAILDGNEQMIVANMNMNLAQNAQFLWKIEDFLHYKDVIDAVWVNRFGDEEWRPELEQLTGRKFEAAIIGYTNTGEKYLMGLDIPTISILLANQFKGKTLLVKWGLYKSGLNELLYFPNSRIPNVVIYNRVQELQADFIEWDKSQGKTPYLYAGAAPNHPFNSLFLKDKNNVLYCVNTFGNDKIHAFLQNNREHLISSNPQEVVVYPDDYNNYMSIWNGLPWEVDWFRSMIDGSSVIYR